MARDGRDSPSNVAGAHAAAPPAGAGIPGAGALPAVAAPSARERARGCGLVLGRLRPGPLNAITDVAGVRVGHVTLFAGEGSLREGHGPVRTGVTAILPHGDNLFREKVAAAVHVINAFGKPIGTTQIVELGVLETPIVLTNTLGMGAAFDGLVEHALGLNPEIGRSTGSVNPVAAECNDGALNDIRGRHVRPEHILAAIAGAAMGPVAEGVVGAGTGMSCYGWKGGIGTSSRRLVDGSEQPFPPYTVGVLVLANFGRPADLVVDGVRVGRTIRPPQDSTTVSVGTPGSCVIVVATDAPADARQLGRIARRVQNGLAYTGTFGQHGSGEFVLAFSTARRIAHWPSGPTASMRHVAEDGPLLDELFQAVAEATEEAVVNALFTADTVTGVDGHSRHGLPVQRVIDLLSQVNVASASPRSM